MVIINKGLRCLACSALLLILFCLVSIRESQGALITYTFEGTVTGVGGFAFEELHPVNVGQTLTGSLTYETSTPDINLLSQVGYYEGAITNLSFAFPSYSGGIGGSNAINFIDIEHNFSPYGDRINLGAPVTGPAFNGVSPEGFLILLQDFRGEAVSNTALGTIPPLSAFPQYHSFNLRFSDIGYGNSGVAGTLTSLTPVPLPAAAVLFPTGLSLLAWMFRMREERKRHTRHH